jgi:hypothetical protein
MTKRAVVTITLIPEAEGIQNANLKKHILKSIECDWLFEVSDIEITTLENKEQKKVN